jgi:hypothetical protein
MEHMKVHIPRMVVGTLLLGMAGVMLVLLVAAPVGPAPAGHVLIMLSTAFVGTQVYFGRPIPGFRRRVRSVR